MLATQFGGKLPYAAELSELIEQQLQIELVYTFYLGVRDNLEHFQNPIGYRFLDMDFDEIHREDRIQSLPDYAAVQDKLDQFHRSLPEEHRDMTDPITAYETYIETWGLKIAHYCGFLFGDRLYSCVIPGYAADWVYTVSYRSMVENALKTTLPR